MNRRGIVKEMDDSDYVMDADREQMTAVEQLIDRTREQVIEKESKETEQYIRQVIQQTDWDELSVVDVVRQLFADDTIPDPPMGDITQPMSFRTHGYRSFREAPNTPDVYYDVGDHHKRVFRLTEEVCREIGIDPETGTDVA